MLIGLAIGARIILYDGSPFYPDLRGYLKFIDAQKSVQFLPALHCTQKSAACLF